MSQFSNDRQVIIIGAGIHGLAAAKTYLEINPDVQLTIIDNEDSVGGVWSRSRVHPNLVADSPIPTFDFSDLQMSEEFNLPAWSDISGTLMYEYLERYAKKFDILKRCVFNTNVTNVERNGKGWLLHTKQVGDDQVATAKTYTCDVLMVATGTFSIPQLPNIDTSRFQGKVFHTKDLNKRSAELSLQDIETVAVVGGNKSSFEAVCLCYKAGKKVHWLIRENVGAGPGLLMQASLPNGMSTARLGYLRVFGLVLPTIYRQTRSWWDRFFLSGKNAWGRKLFDWFWENATLKRVGDRYDKSPNGKLLRPDIVK
jgi:cation diffusion facilitator CzcD-associated flavoprotein CzcO